RYNGLGYLIREEDVAASEWKTNVYDGSWRVVARYVGSANIDKPTEEYVYHRAGNDGLGGSSYVDLVAMRGRDTDTGAVGFEESVYYCQDRQANVVVVLGADGSVQDWVKYRAYGIPFMSPPGDMDGNGMVTGGAGSDMSIIAALVTSGYDVKADLDLDGNVDSADQAEIGSTIRGIAFGSGVLSRVESEVGFKGYRATSSANHTWYARNRFLLSGQGRWQARDMLIYDDGSNMYQALQSVPLGALDPMGLQVVDSGGEGQLPEKATKSLDRPGKRSFSGDHGSHGELTSRPGAADRTSFMKMDIGVSTFSGCGDACEGCTFSGRVRLNIAYDHGPGPMWPKEDPLEWERRWHGPGFRGPDPDKKNGERDINWRVSERGKDDAVAKGGDQDSKGAGNRRSGTTGWSTGKGEARGNPNVGVPGADFPVYPPHGRTQFGSSGSTYDISTSIECGGEKIFIFRAYTYERPDGRMNYAEASVSLSCPCCMSGVQ
ncbi:MAG: hypothetical protein KDB07_09890, partial [Planctomycetes bacterium]|nr:hypothetical protein [Planctomycetota bacterium]